jgi:hypothetical protein
MFWPTDNGCDVTTLTVRFGGITGHAEATIDTGDSAADTAPKTEPNAIAMPRWLRMFMARG